MKVALVYPHSEIPVPPVDLFDALAVVTFEISRRLARDAEVVVFPRRPRGERAEDMFEGVRVRRIPVLADQGLNALKFIDRWRDPRRPFRTTALYYPLYARRVAQQLRRERCDVVHLYNFTSFLPVFRAALPRARIVLHIHDHALTDFDPEVFEPRLRHVSLILACSEFVTDNIRERFPRVRDRCHTLHNGVDLEVFSPSPRDGTAAESTAKRILFVGRLSPEKGVHVLLEAFERVIARVPDAELNLIGPNALAPKQFVDPFDRDPQLVAVKSFYGDPEGYLARLRDDLSPAARDRVKFFGRIPNAHLAEHYRRSRVFVFPSLWHEPFGMPILEAMASGLPVVATRGGAFAETVDDGKTGLLVARGDPVALAEALERLLTDEGLARGMGEAGRKRAEDHFSWDAKVEELKRLYDAAPMPAAGPSRRD